MGEFWNIVLKIMASAIFTFSSFDYDRTERRPGDNGKILARVTFIQDNYEEATKLDNLQLNEIKSDEIEKKRERFEEELQTRKNIEKETVANKKQGNRGDEEELWERLENIIIMFSFFVKQFRYFVCTRQSENISFSD